MACSMIVLISAQALPNLLGPLEFCPDHIFMLHTGEPRLRLVMDNLSDYLSEIFPGIKIEKFEVVANDPDSVRTRCLEIVSRIDGKNIVINATCGTKLMAIGAFQAGLEAGLPVIYVDTQQGKFLNLGNVKVDFPGGTALPQLKIDDFLGICGARIKEEGTRKALENQERLLPLCKFMIDNKDDWCELQNYLDVARRRKIQNLKYSGPFSVYKKKNRYTCNVKALTAYQKAGLITDVKVNESQVSFCFVDDWAKEVFLTKGSVLELLVFYTLSPVPGIEDIRLGVRYVWGDKVENELDVLVSVSSRLICFSCKSGSVNSLNLTELESNANRLGGIFVKKIMVIGESGEKYPHFCQRAKEMGIHVIDYSMLRNNAQEALCAAIFGSSEGVE